MSPSKLLQMVWESQADLQTWRFACHVTHGWNMVEYNYVTRKIIPGLEMFLPFLPNIRFCFAFLTQFCFSPNELLSPFS